MERKSLYDISWQVSEEEYRNDPAYSYSTIARFNREGFNGLDNLFDKLDTPSLLFGSMVDTLITDGQEGFDNNYLVADFPSVPDSIVKIVKSLFEEFGVEHRSLNIIPDIEIIRHAGIFEYQNNWKPETRAKVIKEKGADYYNLLFLAADKTIVSNEDYIPVVSCVETLKTSPVTKFYFESDNPFNNNIERLYQLKFKGTWESINLRCMADLVIVDHENKTVTPCDLKTSFHYEWEFYHSFMTWNYWIQAQLYWYIIRQNMDNDPLYKDYKLLDYRFIVISKKSMKPLVWIYNDTTATVSLTYGTRGQYVCRNWREIVGELHHYMITRPEYPQGIRPENDLINWLNNE